MYLLAPFILQNLKNLLQLIQSYEDMLFSRPKWPICPEQSFFRTNHCYYFDLPIGPCHCAKFKNILTADAELWRYAIFGPKMVHLRQKFFFLESCYYHSHLPISCFYCAKFKKDSSSRSRVMRICSFWA